MKMITPLCALVAVIVIVFMVHAVVADVKPLKLTVRPTVSFAPAQVTIQVRIQPEDTDRWINVAMDNGDFRRSSGFTIEPDRRLYVVSWRDVPAGDYVIAAAVGAGDRTRATDTARLTVAGPPH